MEPAYPMTKPSYNPTSHAQWEYRLLERPHQLDLNALGLEGWELVAVTESTDTSSCRTTVAYLKRRIATNP